MKRPVPRIRDQAILFPLTLQNTLLWFALTALAYVGNMANITLSANVTFFFGTIPVFIILHFFGWVPATLSALIASTHTAMVWEHPYGAIVVAAEVLSVGILYRRRSANLMLLDTGYWVIVGMPLLVLFYRVILGSASTATFVDVCRMAVNGIFNALIASLVTAAVEQIIPRFRHSPSRNILGFAQAIFLVMVAFVLIPAMFILVVTARQEMRRVEGEVRARLEITEFSALQALNAWMSENMQTLDSLATFAGQVGQDDPDELRAEMRLLNMSDPDFSVLAVTDADGEIVVAEPYALSGRWLRGIRLGGDPYFSRVLSEMQGVASNVIFGSEAADTPVVVLGVPIVPRDRLVGAVLGILDTTRLRGLLTRISGNWTVNATVTDGNGIIIASNMADVEPFTSYDREFPGPYHEVTPEVSVRMAGGRENRPNSQRWQYSEYSVQRALDGPSDWTLSLHAAMAPYQEELNERYRALFFMMVLVIVVTTLLSAFVSRRMLGSLLQLTTVAEELSETMARREEPQWPVSHIDEIHSLVQSFRSTSEQLSASFNRLQTANEELAAAKQQAELANRTKSEFLANISHDLRTPLNGILGYAQILARDPDLDENTRSAVSIIEKSGNHLLNLINDILDVSRIEADKLHLEIQPFYLTSFLDDIADIVSLQSRQKGLEFIVDFSGVTTAVVLGDEKRLRQVLLNLLNNAVKFTNRGHVRFAAATNGEVLHAEVEDTGIGIPPEELDAIFSPFKQLTKHIQSDEGTGLGLAIVRRLVAMMDGSVRVTSTPNGGSVFTVDVTLPPADSAPPVRESASTVTGYKGAVRTVLVVDDKAQNRSVLMSMLSPLGFTVLEAADGAEGLEVMSRARPDLVLMDLVMPRLDGFDAIRAVREDAELKEIRVVAVSASVASSIRDECLRLGFDEFIPKPFRDAELFRVIGQLLRIEWIHRRLESAKSHADQAIAIPPTSDLESIIEQAEAGNIRGLVTAAADLESENPDFAPFARRISAMAREFRIEELTKYLEQIRFGRESSDE